MRKSCICLLCAALLFSTCFLSGNPVLGQNRPERNSKKLQQKDYLPGIAKVKAYFDQAEADGTQPGGYVTVRGKGKDAAYSFQLPNDFRYDINGSNYGKGVEVDRIAEILVVGLCIDDSFLEMLAVFSNVEKISFQSCSFSPDAQYRWDGFPSLKSLRISNRKKASPSTILQHAKNLKLECLAIDVSDSRVLSDCRSLSGLQDLSLIVHANAELNGKDALEWISPEIAENIQILSLEYVVTNKTAKALHKFTKLRSLTFHGDAEQNKKATGVTDAFLAQIADIPLKQLASSRGVSLTDKSVPVLVKWKSLNFVMLGATRLSPQGAREVYASRKWNYFHMQPRE